MGMRSYSQLGWGEGEVVEEVGLEPVFFGHRLAHHSGKLTKFK
jgi:hypothetical protein